MPRRIVGSRYALAAVPFIAAAGAARADDVEDALGRVERAAEADPALSPETRDALRELTRALRAERSRPPDGDALRAAVEQVLAESPGGASAAAPTVRSASSLSFSGDLRLRHESNVHLDGDAEDRHRQRIRLRVGAQWKLDEQFDVGARVRTGSRSDSNSPHQTLGEGFHSFEIALDRAFLHYRPCWLPELDAWAGKFGSPLVTNPVYGELVWDADVQPEGLVARHVAEIGDGAKLGLIAGEYVVIEQGSGSEASAFVAQGWADAQLGEATRGRLSLSWHRFNDLTPDDSAVVLNDNQGNALTTHGTPPTTDYASDFSVLDAVASLETSVGGVPATVAVEWIRNLDARIDGDTGYAIGASLGRAKEPGDLRFAYQWQVIEQDAVASAFANDDFLLPTNQRGHVASLRYQLTPAIDLQLAAYVSEYDDAPPSATDTGSQWRIRFDINVAF